MSKKKEIKYKKSEIVANSELIKYVDIINAIVKDDEELTFLELKNKINNFLKREVK